MCGRCSWACVCKNIFSPSNVNVLHRWKGVIWGLENFLHQALWQAYIGLTKHYLRVFKKVKQPSVTVDI